MTLTGKTIAITGALSGIGARAAARVNAGGGKVVTMDLNGGDIAFDQSDPRSIDAAAERLPQIDGLMNIAGIPPADRFSPADVLRVNFYGLRRLTERAAAKMNPGAPIVNMSSVAGSGWPDNLPMVREMLAHGGADGMDGVDELAEKYGVDNNGLTLTAAYPLSKQLVTAWTMKSAMDWRKRGFRMNAVAPGPVQTPILEVFVKNFGDAAAAHVESCGVGDPEDVAKVAVFLASDDSCWMRGAVLPADGGIFALLNSERCEL